MTGLRGIKNNVGGGGGSVGGRGMDPNAGRVQLKDLPVEQQNAHEILEALKGMGESAMRARIVDVAGAQEPVGAQGLRLVAELYASLQMPLSVVGVQRFKQDRGLTGGTLGGHIAKAYARALDGNEILVRVDRREEAGLRPSEKACLQFLREMQRHVGADALRPVKKALELGNPPIAGAAKQLENEWVGVNTVIEIARVTTMRSIPLSRLGWKQLVEQLAREADENGDG